LLFNWDGANVSKVEAERILDVLTRILTWITEGDSRRLLGDALECLDGLYQGWFINFIRYEWF
jgi:hypothetical protein